MQQNAGTQGWHIAQWGTWGWAETLLKLIAIGSGVLAFAQSNADSPLVVGNNPHLAALILLALLTLAALAQILIRFQQRETISLLFAVFNLLGHLGLLLALLRVPTSLALAVVFGAFFVLGQLTKLQFLRVTGYTEGGADSRAMLRIAAAMAVIYALFAILSLL